MYSRKIADEVYTFGVSGKLYKSNVLIYDHQTESLWSQLMEKAVTGPLANSDLHKIPSQRMTWEAWKRRHPETTVLSTNTGYKRDYSIDPYTGYYQLGGFMFPVGDVRNDLPAKTRILGIEINGSARAYPLDTIHHADNNMTDTLGGVPIRIEVDASDQIVGVFESEGQSVAHIYAYWFAWQAFHPDTTVYRKSK